MHCILFAIFGSGQNDMARSCWFSRYCAGAGVVVLGSDTAQGLSVMSLKTLKPIRLEIEPGEIVLEPDSGVIMAESADMVAISIDLTSKYAECTGLVSGSDPEKKGRLPGVMLQANERTIATDPQHKDVFTLVSFPEYRGYTVFATHLGRYTLHVVLINFDCLVDNTPHGG